MDIHNYLVHAATSTRVIVVHFCGIAFANLGLEIVKQQTSYEESNIGV